MSRLTRKVQLCRDLITGIELKYEAIENENECIDKLGTLEDLEEELGIDLILSVSICKKANSQKYVYMKDSYGISKLTFLNDLDVELFHHRLYANSWGVWVSLDLKEYGKEWSLTRDELENERISENS